MKGENNLIHIKLEFSEAVESKKDMLYSQQALLKLAQIIKQYRTVRTEELKLKLKIHKKMQEVVTNINKLQKILPEIEIPSIKKREEKIKTTTRKDDNLEYQLKEIQNRLRALDR